MIPIVMHHGMFGFGNIDVGRFHYSYFHRIDRALIDRGHRLIVSRVHPTGSIATRARQLKQTILRQLRVMGEERQPVVIIGHSMGGLDARYMISQLGMAEHVRALVTVCTPHRGSTYADWCLKNLGQRLGALRLLNLVGLDVSAVNDVTTTSCRRFNEQVKDVPGVRYYSISAARPWSLVPPFLMHAWRCIDAAEGANDGLVSVKSAIWGEHLGTWPADHFHTINKRLVLTLHNPTGDITPYYMKVIERLEREHLFDEPADAPAPAPSPRRA